MGNNKVSNFNSKLEKDLFRGSFQFNVSILRKGKRICQWIFSSSYTIDEIYKILKKKYPNAKFKIELKLIK